MTRCLTKRFGAYVIGIFFVAISLPVLGQSRLSSDDQSRFDSYYSRWMEDQQRNDRDETASMERRMRDIYYRNNIPMNTPFWRVASNARQQRGRQRWNLSGSDQQHFDSYYTRWQDYRQRNDREQTRSMESRMKDLYRRYNIPGNAPYFWVASNARDEDWDRWEQNRWRGQLSPDDQRRFDSYFGRWMQYRQTNNRDETASMEKRMFDIYATYNIPRQVPWDVVASGGR